MSTNKQQLAASRPSRRVFVIKQVDPVTSTGRHFYWMLVRRPTL